MAIVFGSPDALRILEKDKFLRSCDDIDDDELAELRKRLKDIETDIAAEEELLDILRGERSEILLQLTRMGAL